MQEGRPSFTAMYVAFARAVATYDRELSRVCNDHVAELLLPHALGNVIAAAKMGSAADVIFAALRASSLGFFDHMALRTRLIDDAVTRETDSGARQLVLLGAGLDSRAHRLHALRESRVYEVDFPSTQAMKKRKAGALPRTAREIHYVACDFEQARLDEVLCDIGFDPSQPSVWVWEGVTMYLEADVVAASIATISSLSAAGSSLVASYFTPETSAYAAPFVALASGLLSAVAEPIRASFRADTMRDLLDEQGYGVESDVLPRDSRSRYGVAPTHFHFAMPAEHIVLARRREDQMRAPPQEDP